METDKKEAGYVRRPRVLKKAVGLMLTENEAAGAVLVRNSETDAPEKLFFETKRPDAFPQGARLRFRNKFCTYSWKILGREETGWGKTQIYCGEARKIYSARGKTKP